jgi:hypothetical protein
VQMRLSFSSLAPLFLYLIQWLDCGCCYALPSYLGLFHILICKVQIKSPCFTCVFLIYRYTNVLSFMHKNKIVLLIHRFMLMEIAQCQHMRDEQALENSMVITLHSWAIMLFILVTLYFGL